MAALNRRVERAGLLRNLGPCCKALCARRDFAIRRQLLKNDKVDAAPSPTGQRVECRGYCVGLVYIFQLFSECHWNAVGTFCICVAEKNVLFV